jgi:uncharacterized membrane protein
MSPSRMEAFSDGVIAIAITLLVIEIHVPAPGEGSLGHELAQQWPSYAAYVVSFLTIGVIWINHHAAIARIQRTDHTLLVLNLVLLMAVAILPFTTALMADYLREDEGQHLAAGIYSASFLLVGVAFLGLQRHALRGPSDLVRSDVDALARRVIIRRSATGLAPYMLAVVTAAVSPYLALAICGAVALYYALPGTPGAARGS